nr:uncharacterized protein LOC100184701 [Ciona intestinalis]|eukprot:XP_009861732.2 uncharacterized protein LOC100184701 [Ciona intestinalis]
MLSTAPTTNRVRTRSESEISDKVTSTGLTQNEYNFKRGSNPEQPSTGCRVYLHNADVIVTNCFPSPPASPTTTSETPDDSCDVRSRDSGRPMSLSSVTSTLSSRTSRGSDYFSSASTGENGQVTSYRHGTFELLPDVREVVPRKTSQTFRLHDSVREEEEGSDDEAPELPPKTLKKENGVSKHLTLPRNTRFNPPTTKPNTVSVRDINKKLREVDHLSPVSTMAMLADPHLTYVDRIILELIETERMFVRALEDVLAGYILAIKNTPELPISAADVEVLFGNIKDIYVFNRGFLSYIENCERNPVKIAACFVSEDVSFTSYTEYCTSYPGSVAMLTRCMKIPTLADFFKNQQDSLRHSLPLGSYLLKPVQRILKYHLILQELVKYCKKDLEGYDIIERALSTMTYIAHHINEMKRKHEDAVHVQEIQSLLTNWRGDDLTTYGELAMEGQLKLQGAKNERLTFLFDKMILITKRREDGFLVCKVHIMCSDLMLLESIQNNPLRFLILPFDNYSPHNHGQQRKLQYTLTARSADEKKLWTHNIKRLIIKNHHAAIPIHAQRSILSLSPGEDGVQTNEWQPTKNSRFSNISMDENKTKATLSRFGSTISSSGLGIGVFPPKTRRRSDSSSKKSLHLKALKRRDEVTMSDDFSSDSVPNTPSGSNKPRFSFPVPRLGGSKHDSPPVPPKPKPALTKKAEPTPKYKDSVIYRRHKRRTSQPITFVEKRLSIKIDEAAEGKTELDPDDLDEFLNFSVENSRESVSWDIQIVEAVFERFKNQEPPVADVDPPPPISSTAVPLSVHKTQNKVLTSSESSENEDFSSSWTEKMRRRATTRPMRSNLNRTETQPAMQVMHKSDTETSFKQEQQDEEIKMRRISDGACDNFSVDANHLIHRKASNAEASEMLFSDDKPNPSVEESHDCTQQRSQAGDSLYRSNSANQNRRKYFERLKEIRDRRISKRILGVDGLAIPQGRVKNMITQHRVSINDQSLGARSPITPSPSISYKSSLSPTSPNTPGFSVKSPQKNNISENPFFTKWRETNETVPEKQKSPQSPPLVTSFHPPEQKVRFRRSTIRSLDLDSMRNSRFSSLTTASLPLDFTTSSSSGDDIFEEKSEVKLIKTMPTLLWRSYSQDHGSCTRRSRNLLLDDSEAFGASNSKTDPSYASNRRLSSPLDSKAFLSQKVGHIPENKNIMTDKLSEQVDHVWKDLETEHPVHTDTSTQDESSILSGKESSKSETSQQRNKKENKEKIVKRSISEEINSKLKDTVIDETETDKAAMESPVLNDISAKNKEFQANTLSMDKVTSKEDTANTKVTTPIHVDAKTTTPILNAPKTRGRHRARGNRQSSVESTAPNIVAKLTSQFNHLASPTKQQQRSKSVGAGKHLNKFRYTGFKPTTELKNKFEQNTTTQNLTKSTTTTTTMTSHQPIHHSSPAKTSHNHIPANKERYSEVPPSKLDSQTDSCDLPCTENKTVKIVSETKTKISPEKIDTETVAEKEMTDSSTVTNTTISHAVATSITLTTPTTTSTTSRTTLRLSNTSKIRSTPTEYYSHRYTSKYSPQKQASKNTPEESDSVDFISMFCRKIETTE